MRPFGMQIWDVPGLVLCEDITSDLDLPLVTTARVGGWGVRGSDLVVSKDSGRTEIGFAYEKRIPLFGNVSLLIDYAGTTDPSGVAPEVSAEKNNMGATAP